MSAKKSSAPRSGARAAPRLKDRRRQGRRRLASLIVLLLLLLAAGGIYGLWQGAVRIVHVEVQGAEALLPGEAPEALARAALLGSYFGIIPRDSIFFFAERRIRARVLAAHPEVAAISIARQDLTSIVVRVSLRTAVGRWCGLAPIPEVASLDPTVSSTTPDLVPGPVTPYCYFYDPNGFIYSAVPEADATSNITVETLNSFALYAPLVGDTEPARPDDPGHSGGEPLRATIVRANELPDAFAFARQVSNLGSPTESVVVRDDEADILLASGTRVTYVLGHEQEAYAALTSAEYARPDFSLASGELIYVDLRFPGKLYLKKKE